MSSPPAPTAYLPQSTHRRSQKVPKVLGGPPDGPQGKGPTSEPQRLQGRKQDWPETAPELPRQHNYHQSTQTYVHAWHSVGLLTLPAAQGRPRHTHWALMGALIRDFAD